MPSPRITAFSSSTRRYCSCRRRRLAPLLPGAAAAEADLGEARALAHDDAEGARDDLGVELALIARGHLVEGAAAVGDEAREDVEPAGGALGIGGGGDPAGKPEPLQQRHDIDAVPLQDRALGQVDLMQRELLDLLGDRRILARQEARPDPVGDGAQAQVEARRLHLSRQHVDLGPDLIVADQGADLLIGQQSGTGRACGGRGRFFARRLSKSSLLSAISRRLAGLTIKSEPSPFGEGILTVPASPLPPSTGRHGNQTPRHAIEHVVRSIEM